MKFVNLTLAAFTMWLVLEAFPASTFSYEGNVNAIKRRTMITTHTESKKEPRKSKTDNQNEIALLKQEHIKQIGREPLEKDFKFLWELYIGYKRNTRGDISRAVRSAVALSRDSQNIRNCPHMRGQWNYLTYSCDVPEQYRCRIPSDCPNEEYIEGCYFYFSPEEQTQVDRTGTVPEGVRGYCTSGRFGLNYFTTDGGKLIGLLAD